MSDFRHGNIDFGSVSYSKEKGGKTAGYMIVFAYYNPIPSMDALIKDIEQKTEKYNCWTIEDKGKKVVNEVLSFSGPKTIEILKKEYTDTSSVNQALVKLKALLNR